MKYFKKTNLTLFAAIAAFTSMVALPSLHAAEVKATESSDKTGTNPINFTFDARLYNEYQWLNTAGDGWQNLTTFEFRVPFAGGKWQFRTRLRSAALEADLNDDGIDDVDEWGFGDMDFRILTVPYLDMSRKMAIATGLEVFLPTASEDALGSNALSLGPQVFAVFFKPFGGFFDLIAPAYQHKISVYEESGFNNVHQGLIDLFLLKTFGNKKKWSLINPQAVIDYENDREFMLVEAEVGTMLDDILDIKGHSVYMRPSVGIGNDRPYDFSLEAGYKIVW